MKTIKLLVAHPKMQHSMKAALAIKSYGHLIAYETMNYYFSNKKQILDLLDKNPSVERFIRRCSASGLENGDIKTHLAFWGLILEVIARIDRKGIVYYKLYNIVSGAFGKRVANDVIRMKADGVIMYDFTAVTCFERLQKCAPDKVRILDMSSIPTKIIDDIISSEEEKGYANQFKLKRKRYSHKNCLYYHQEIELADYFISPSKSVTDGLMELGIAPTRILHVPFGVDLKSFNNIRKKRHENKEKVSFLYVGRMEAAKGIIYLLDAFEKLEHRKEEFRLVLVGESCGNEYLFRDYSFVEYLGVVSKERMIEIYDSCDVFVFPSLWEGCSLSLMEALSCGLPAIATERSGVLQFVADGEGGFCIPGGNSNELQKKVSWFIDHKEMIPLMGQVAANSMRRYSWENYSKNLTEQILTLFK